MQKSSGFTLVELLVVIAIIALLIALLLPAVSSARESGRRSACMSHIRQLQMGVINYESAKMKYPPGALQSGIVWSALVLPYIEQGDLFDKITLTDVTETAKDPVGFRYWRQSPVDSLINADIDLFKCPSYSRAYVSTVELATDPWNRQKLNPNYVPCGSHIVTDDTNSSIFQQGPDGVMTGAFVFGEGLEGRRFTDGLSKTIFLGEVVSWGDCATDEEDNGCGRCHNNELVGKSADKDHAFLGSDDLDNLMDASEFFCSTAYPPNALTGFLSCNNETRSTIGAAYEMNFGSEHGGISLFAMGDGSARTIADEVDPVIFRALGSRQSGESDHNID